MKINEGNEPPVGITFAGISPMKDASLASLSVSMQCLG